MQLYLLRHGVAEEARGALSDAERRLTEEGVEQMRAVGHALAHRGLRLDALLSSPLARARETARIVAEALDAPLAVEPSLAGGFSLGALQEIVGRHADVRRAMLVGHEPSLSRVAGQLVGGAAIELKKGGLIWIEADRLEPGGGVLRWLVTPSLLVRG
ncbi:MAG: phosphohistidine phosphatase SixA [Chthonomonadales bacterium]|nr:phosphohistidine phosphatase SixA [Chthonomonadales bacterium]